MTDLTINGETFAVAVTGDPTRPVLMLSHALGTNHRMWDGQLEPLEKHFRVVRYDARGHGGSTLGREPVSLHQLGRDALAIMDALDIDRAHWLGLSMGGMVGLWLLAHAPERIERAIIANSAPRIGTADAWNERILSVREHGMAKVTQATLERWFGAAYAEREPQQIADFKDMLQAMDPAGYAAVCAALRDTDLHAAVRGIQNDVLVIMGRNDPTVTPADAKALAAALPSGRLVELDARHVSNVEAKTDFNAAVVAFLTAKRMPRSKPRLAAGVKKSSRTKPPVPERGSASRRSNAARNPLKGATEQAAPAKTTAKTTTQSLPSKSTGARTKSTGARIKSTGARATAAAQHVRPSKGVQTTPAVSKGKSKAGAASPAKTSSAKTSSAKTSSTKTSPAKASSTKTSSAKTRADNKLSAKKPATKKLATKTLTTKKPATKKLVAKKPVGKKAAAKPAVRKAKARSIAAKSAPARRERPLAKARGAVKTPVRKAGRPKSKAAAPKSSSTKGRSKTIRTAKPAAAVRRKIVKKPRRPASRRKP